MRNKRKTYTKAGVIPFYVNESGELVMLFMVPSDPLYGGDRLQIAKGTIDFGEAVYLAAIREGYEELGLLYHNIDHTFEAIKISVLLTNDTYMLVYVFPIIDKLDFAEPHYETGRTEWLTLSQFEIDGKAKHLSVVRDAVNKVYDVLHKDDKIPNQRTVHER